MPYFCITMKSFFICISLFAFFCWAGCTGKDETGLYAFTLQTVEHKDFSFDQLRSKKAAVFIFLQPECPFCNSYGKTLRELDSLFEDEGIALIGIVAGKNYPEPEIIAYSTKNKLHFPMLLDPDFVLQKKLWATTTPEAFLADNEGNIVYRGMIDNWGYEIGKVRPKVTEHYLTDAVNSLLKNRPIDPDSTKAIGCYIE